MSSIPPNMVLIPRGGRPRKDSRNVAVYLAYHWRRELVGESARLAEEWVISQWRYSGITDPAHVRATVKRARDRTWLKNSYLAFNEGLTFNAAVESEIARAEEGRLEDWVRLPDIPPEFHRNFCAVCAMADPYRKGWGGACLWIAGMLPARVAKLVELSDLTPPSEVSAHTGK
jgi:hypothetical protein